MDGCIHEGAERLIGFVEELPGANPQGETLEEARPNVGKAGTMGLG